MPCLMLHVVKVHREISLLHFQQFISACLANNGELCVSPGDAVVKKNPLENISPRTRVNLRKIFFLIAKLYLGRDSF